MISRLGLLLCKAFGKVMPDPFVLAVLLTLVTFALALIWTESTPGQLLTWWSGDSGVWSAGILRFAMQMCLILVTGHALASSPPMSWAMDRLAGLPNSGKQAAALVAAVAATLSVLNWGVGLIGGALMARRVDDAMRRKGIHAHTPLLAASGFVGMLVWHGGLSGSAPLKVTNQKEIADIFGAGKAPFDAIPLTETIFSPLNLFVTLGLLVIVPIVMGMMSPRDHSREGGGSVQPPIPAPEPVHLRQADPHAHDPLLPRLLDRSPLITVLLVVLIALWAWRFYFPADLSKSGILSLTPDAVNMTMLMLGLALHGTPARYLRAVDEAASSCAGIILQFPLYAGILGILQQSGLDKLMADSLAATTDKNTLPLLTMAAACIINFFVPSGGGQWAVQGPVAMHAAVAAGVEPGRIVLAVAYGDQITNMLQPFWALPLLAITGTKARDIMGYTAVVMIVAAVWITAGMLLF